MAVKLGNVVRTIVNAKTGTKIEKAIGSEKALFKLITFGENSKMKSLGVDQVKLSKYPDGSKYITFYNGIKQIFGGCFDKQSTKSFMEALKMIAKGGAKIC